MRDIIVVLMFLVSLPICLTNPVRGVLIFALFAYLNPHRLAWGFATEVPVAFGIAIATLIGYVYYNGDKRLPKTLEVYLIILFWLLTTIGYPFALNPEGHMQEWTQFSKILLMILVTICLIKTREHLRLLYMVVVFSIGFYIIKGTIWGIRGGAEAGGLIWGPDNTFIGGNNEMGLAVNMVWPLFYTMALSEKKRWLKLLSWSCFIASPFAVVLTQSRGAALAMAVTAIFLALRARSRFVLLTVGLVSIILIVPFIPEQWYSRMETIQTYEEDASAMGRINAWHAGWNLALDRPWTGGGMRGFTPEVIGQYAPDPENYHDVHSIYFQVLGEIGFPGLFAFLALIIATLFRLLQIQKRAKTLPNAEFFGGYANATLIGMLAFLVNGAFLGLAYFDLFYQYIGLAVSLHVVMRKELASAMEAGEYPPWLYLDPDAVPHDPADRLDERGVFP